MCRAEPTGDRSPRPLCPRWAELTGDSLRPLLVVAALRKVGAGEVDLLRSMFCPAKVRKPSSMALSISSICSAQLLPWEPGEEGEGGRGREEEEEEGGGGREEEEGGGGSLKKDSLEGEEGGGRREEEEEEEGGGGREEEGGGGREEEEGGGGSLKKDSLEVSTARPFLRVKLIDLISSAAAAGSALTAAVALGLLPEGSGRNGVKGHIRRSYRHKKLCLAVVEK